MCAGGGLQTTGDRRIILLAKAVLLVGWPQQFASWLANLPYTSRNLDRMLSLACTFSSWSVGCQITALVSAPELFFLEWFVIRTFQPNNEFVCQHIDETERESCTKESSGRLH